MTPPKSPVPRSNRRRSSFLAVKSLSSTPHRYIAGRALTVDVSLEASPLHSTVILVRLICRDDVVDYG
ncbi:expressed protein [Arabidopsis lyrata subsp. lyrata]|uniref:Expressed protein n=1 Tax=Arabidopsis lyrata subsp. lyrata TaxID=81972 RepID=D7MJH3_ARALL|nr:expressed protein [Arabidopsis lyrata subsp. lyrata]